MATDGQPGGRWLVRKPDGTELRFPSLDALREYILAGVVGPEDVVQPDGDTWARVEELAELAQLLRQVAPSRQEMARVRRPTHPPESRSLSTRPASREHSITRRPLAPPPPGSRPLQAEPTIRHQRDPAASLSRPMGPPPLPSGAEPYNDPDPLIVVEMVEAGQPGTAGGLAPPLPDLGYPGAPPPQAPAYPQPPVTRRPISHDSLAVTPPPMPQEALTGQRPLAARADGRLPASRPLSRPLEPITRGPATGPLSRPGDPLTHPGGYGGDGYEQPLRRPTHSLSDPGVHAQVTSDTNVLESRVITRASALGAAGYLDEDELQDMMRRATSRRRYWLAILSAVLLVLLIYIGYRVWQDRSATKPEQTAKTPVTQATSAAGSVKGDSPKAPAVPGEPARSAVVADAGAAASGGSGDASGAAAGDAAEGPVAGEAPAVEAVAPPATKAEAKPEPSKEPATRKPAARKPATEKPATRNPARPAKKPEAAPAGDSGKGEPAKEEAASEEPKRPPPSLKPKTDPDSFDGLMKAAKRAKPYDQLRLYKKALALKPSNPDAMRSVGRAYLKTGQASQAIDMFKKCRMKAPRYSPCLYWLGRAYGQSGQSGQARATYQKLVDEFPESSTAADARKRLGP